MVEKIFISPGNVRGLGNIVSVKTGSDFSGNYANIVQLEDGDFILSYEGLLLKFTTRLDNTIKDMTAYLYCTVLLEEDNSPVSDLVVSATYEDGTVLTETTDSNGEVTFTWTPLALGNEVVTLSCEKQGDYASHSDSVSIRVGLLLNFYKIMTHLDLVSDDEEYQGTFETPVEYRSQLSTFITDIFVADGGERCVARDGLVYIASPGDLVVEYDNLEQDDDYSNVVFSEEVDRLVGAVSGMSILDNEDIVLTRLQRFDIIGEYIVGQVKLELSSSAVFSGGTIECTATVLDEDGLPFEDMLVSFLVDGVSEANVQTDSRGKAVFIFSESVVGSYVLSAYAVGVSSGNMTVSVVDDSNYIELGVTGPSFSSYNSTPFNYTGGVLVDWGDNTGLIEYTGGELSHRFTDGSSNHTVKIYGDITSLETGCFFNCTGLTSITLPNSVTSLGASCFRGTGLTSINVPSSVTSMGPACFQDCTSLTSIKLNWIGNNILTFLPSWITHNLAVLKFHIPRGTTSLYTAKNYPSAKLVEDGSVTPVVTSVALTSSSSSVTVGSSVTLSATVRDQNGSVMSGETVTFYDGSTSLGTATTNSSGVATKTFTGSAGAHSLTAQCSSITSSAVTVTVTKITPTISISKSGDVTVGTAYTISGTLSCTGSVKLYENGSLLDTLSVSGGAFSKTITKSTSGNYSYYAVYDGDSTYEAVTSSTVTVTVSEIVPSYDDIVLTADDSILSYYDGDSTTLRAQLMDGTSTASVSGVTVEFFNGSTSLGTAQTDSNGVATKTYTSTGAGDISLTASDGTLVSETYEVEDCILYDPLTSNSGKWTIPSGVTSVYSDEGWKISANAYKQIKLTEKLTSACSVEFTLVDYESSNYGSAPPVIVYQYTNGETTPNQKILITWDSTSFDALNTRINHGLVKGAVYKIEYTDSTMKVYENDTLLASATNDVGLPTRFEFHIGANSRYAIYKDLKVKPL